MNARIDSLYKPTLILCLMAVLLLAVGRPAQAAPSENLQVWRMQIYFETSSVDDAGTDDTIRVEVNDNPLVQTALDSPADDFERSGRRTYELRVAGVNRLSDIHYLKIFKDGSDGWAIRTLEFKVNGNTIFARTFPGAGLWLDNEGGHSRTLLISFLELRSSPAWQTYTPLYWSPWIPDMGTRLEGIVGHHITGNALAWGPMLSGACVGDGCGRVTVTRVNGHTLHVDLDLEITLPVDVDFDAEVLCTGSQLIFQLKNITFRASPFAFSEVRSILTQIMPRIQQDMTEVLKHHAIFPQSCYPGFDYVDAQANVRFPSSGPPGGGGGGVILLRPPVTLPPVLKNFLSSPAGVQTAEMTAESADREQAPLVLRPQLPQEAEPGEPVEFAYSLKSGLAADADVDLQFELPASIRLADALIEVTDEHGSRFLAPEFSNRPDGGLLLSRRDRLAAGQGATYLLRVRFSGAGDAEIVTGARAEVVNAGGDRIAVESASGFAVGPDRVRATITGISPASPSRGKE